MSVIRGKRQDRRALRRPARAIGSTSQKAAKLRLELRHARGKRGVARAHACRRGGSRRLIIAHRLRFAHARFRNFRRGRKNAPKKTFAAQPRGQTWMAERAARPALRLRDRPSAHLCGVRARRGVRGVCGGGPVQFRRSAPRLILRLPPAAVRIRIPVDPQSSLPLSRWGVFRKFGMMGCNWLTGSEVVSLTDTPGIAAGVTGIGAPSRVNLLPLFASIAGGGNARRLW